MIQVTDYVMLKLLVATSAALAAPATAAHREDPDLQLGMLLAGRTAGTPTDCINLSGVTSSQVIDGRAIVYRSGGTLYVNTPRSGAESLRDDDVLVSKTIGSQLCSVDTVQLVDRSARFPRGFVLLGKFVPYVRSTRG